jgi:hypothetical protein
MNIIEAIQDPKLFGPAFKDLETWRPWLVFLRALFGLGIQESADLELLRKCTDLPMPPGEKVRECAAICGRRSGKSFISAVIAVFLACFKDWKPYLSPGERGWIFIIAVDKAQAGIIRRYIGGLLHGSAILRRMILKETIESIELKNGVSISVKTCSFRSLRGYTVLCAIMEETAFWRSEDSANPDREVLAALRPAMATIPDSLLISISTPYARRGILYDSFKRNFGQPDTGSFIWKAASATMNPTLDQELIKEALRDDPQAAGAEWLCEWRADIESFLSFESIQACVVPDRIENPPVFGVEYTAFIDPSFGGQDSFTLAIAHAEAEGRVKILDLVRERKPGFEPEEVVAEFAQIILAYRCLEVTSDRFSRDWIKNAFESRGIQVRFSHRSSSEIYLDFMPLVTSRAIELLDHRTLIGQLANLDRRVRSGGRDLVVHFPGRHDDVGVAAAGALTIAGVPQGSTWTAYQGSEHEKKSPLMTSTSLNLIKQISEYEKIIRENKNRIYILQHPSPDFKGSIRGIDFSNGKGSTSSIEDAARLIELDYEIEDDDARAIVEKYMTIVKAIRGMQQAELKLMQTKENYPGNPWSKEAQEARAARQREREEAERLASKSERWKQTHGWYATRR